MNRPRHYLPPPHLLADLVSPEDKDALNDLLNLERKLDWTMLRKKAELNDALGRPVKVCHAYAQANGRRNEPCDCSSPTPLTINLGKQSWTLKRLPKLCRELRSHNRKAR